MAMLRRWWVLRVNSRSRQRFISAAALGRRFPSVSSHHGPGDMVQPSEHETLRGNIHDAGQDRAEGETLEGPALADRQRHPGRRHGMGSAAAELHHVSGRPRRHRRFPRRRHAGAQIRRHASRIRRRRPSPRSQGAAISRSRDATSRRAKAISSRRCSIPRRAGRSSRAMPSRSITTPAWWPATTSSQA